MLRLLLLIPTTTYRTEDFVAAASKLDVELVVASERPNVLESALPDNLLTLDFGDPAKAAKAVAEFARRHRVDAVVPVDDRTTVVGAAIAERLGLRSSSLDAVSTTRNKHRMREAFARAGVRSPRFTLLDVSDDPEAAAARVAYPCVLKPTILAGSRGVIRADDAPSFVAAFRRIAAILQVAGFGGARRGAGGGAGRALHSRAGGRARGIAGRGRAPRPGALRQARPPRRAVLRGDDLRDALAPALPRSSSRSRPRRAGRPGRSGSRRGRSTPSFASTTRGRGWSSWPPARSAASARARCASGRACPWRSWSSATRSGSSSTRSSGSGSRPAS